MSTPNPSAFPLHGTMGEVVESGMTLRDYFAAKAPGMPKFLRDAAESAAHHEGKDVFDFGVFAEWEADWRFRYADAMLKARDA